jgi:hypothetical protein
MVWDLTAFARTTGEEAAPQFSFDVTLTEESFNDAPAVVAPEDATLFPIQRMIPSPERSG